MWENTTQYYYIRFIHEIFIFVVIGFSNQQQTIIINSVRNRMLSHNTIIRKIDWETIQTKYSKHKSYQKPRTKEKARVYGLKYLIF